MRTPRKRKKAVKSGVLPPHKKWKSITQLNNAYKKQTAQMFERFDRGIYD